MPSRLSFLILAGLAVSLTIAIPSQPARGEVDFSREILPILADACFHCHGPDAAARQAELRLDREQEAKADRDGLFVIKPGDVDASELIARIESDDETVQMPPPDSERSLTDRQRRLLRRWIAEGAEWSRHWAFEPPTRPEVPRSPNDDWSRNEIDRFIVARLRKQGWTPAEQATKAELIRRVTFDLTGLPPQPDDIREFLNDDSPDAYERLVDRLFASPRYGEHMARIWLDAARYADTDGYQNDGPRSMWRWRDWVVDAYNRHTPFNQFTIEQLAGDLLPDATFEQRLATGFNRNHRYNSEAGLVLEEFLLENAVDRVDTTSTVWMGLTMGCARCHDHKYDPISQREYYQLIAMFDNVPESGRAVKFGNSEPWMIAPTRSQLQQVRRWDAKVRSAAKALQQAKPRSDEAVEQWLVAGPPADAKPIVSEGLVTHHTFDDADAQKLSDQSLSEGRHGRGLRSDGANPIELRNKMQFLCQSRFSVAFWLNTEQRDGVILSQQTANTRRPGLAVELRDGRLQFYLLTRWVAGVGAVETTEPLPSGRWVHVTLTNDGSQSAVGMEIALDGEPVATRILYNTNSNTGGSAKGAKLRFGAGVHGQPLKARLDDLRIYNRTLFADEIRRLAEPIDAKQPPRDFRTLSAAQREPWRQWWLEQPGPEPPRKLWRAYQQARLQRVKFIDSLPTSMVMSEMNPARTTYLRERGEYHRRGEVVQPAAPEVLGSSEMRNRLDFARWLVRGDHPLTARVAVNRYWQQFFGRGLVKTAEDFGVQGEPPSHPELLDWLATEFVARDWDVAAMQRMIVTSAAYRQSSRATAAERGRDPDNVWLSRGPRLRLSAQQLRDQALTLSGLLVERLGGPSTSPYQPNNLWRELSNMTYRRSKGADLYRRSVYTIWKRTIAPPTMSILDAADRETCAVRQKRTNTPLQALTLLNETAFVEASRKFAERMLREGSDDPLGFGFFAATARRPTAEERAILEAALADAERAFATQPQAAQQLVKIGDSRADGDHPPTRLAAFTVVANLILNLDETVTKQ